MPEALLMQAIETATWAPNGANAQNWRFFIILDKKVINGVADAIQAGMKTMLSWPEMANAVPPFSRPGGPPRIDTIRTAPALIVVAAVRSSNPMVAAMVSRGKTGPLHAKAEIEKLLKIPVGMDVVTLVPVGYPAENPTKDRKPVSEVCQVIK